MGFDVHRLVSGRDLWLGGVKIEHELGLLGHSDADVVIHALCDALLGAACLRDIGYKGFLVGEAFMKTTQPGETLHDYINTLKA